MKWEIEQSLEKGLKRLRTRANFHLNDQLLSLDLFPMKNEVKVTGVDSTGVAFVPATASDNGKIQLLAPYETDKKGKPMRPEDRMMFGSAAKKENSPLRLGYLSGLDVHKHAIAFVKSSDEKERKAGCSALLKEAKFGEAMIGFVAGAAQRLLSAEELTMAERE